MVMSQVSDIFRSTLLDRQIHETWRAEKFVLRISICSADVEWWCSNGLLHWEKKQPFHHCWGFSTVLRLIQNALCSKPSAFPISGEARITTGCLGENDSVALMLLKLTENFVTLKILYS
ncbi:uncharacterized protein LOC103008269 isoform X8 [Balaenoptera acutorostrata]|uniref:Uncharacterized protein LOC103008269 isoform X8 n=1 Tax=Balaenoptera acutorostrata TaxID=9767 RepID=A0ABM3TJK1_BALAC|nr:uncharacterized protein LOC103008269 isoform X8 [Balaenoptera acutorostrata]XP_057402271.1 uncharacterized protein LOC103008269 isoform X8 [Balaenoptera acutorostrata]